jgi:trimeric autotransporter adhesin
MAQPLSGRNPLSYLGVEAVTPPNMIVSPSSPTPTDTRNVTVGDMWINRNTQNFYVLTSLAGGRATWTQVEGSAANQFETDDSNIAVPVGGLLIIHGGTGITTSSSGNTVTITATGGGGGIGTLDGDSGSATGSTVTLAGAGDIVTSASGSTVTFTGSGVITVNADSGTATASSNAVTIAGGSGITTSASGSTVTITASGGAGITTLDGDTGSATGATVTIDTGFVTGPLENGTPSFSGSGSELKLRFDDTDANLGLGFGTLSSKVSPTATENVALGTASAVNLTTGQGNTLVGYNAGASITTGGGNAFIGANVGNNTTITGSDNIVIGVGGGASNFTSASSNVDIAGGLNISTGSFNITMGSASGSSYATSESSNILLNHNGIIGESNVLRIGASTGTFNQSLNSAFICGIDGVDLSTAEVVTMASDQLGSATLTAGSGISITPGAGVITIAATGGGGITTLAGDSGSATGSTVTLTTGGATAEGTALFTGSGATMTLTFSGANNNTAIGHNAFSNAGGQQNTLFGTIAGQFMSGGGSDANTCIGFESGNAISSGGQNTFLGAITNCSTSGSRNLALGYQAGNNLGGTENDNILISSLGTSSESNALHIGRGTGTGSFQLNKAFVSGIQGITVTGTAVLVSSSDQLGIAVSSRRFKSDIQDMGDASSAIHWLRPVSFDWDRNSAPGLKDASTMRQFGLIAEEVINHIPHVVNLDKDGQPLNINYQDLIGMMINEIQKLRKEVDALKQGAAQ